MRIGSRSKSEALKEHNLRKIMFEKQKTGKQQQRSLQDIYRRLDDLSDKIQEAIATLNRIDLSLVQINTIAKPEHVKSMIDGKKIYAPDKEGDLVQIWLNYQKSSPAKPTSRGKKSITTAIKPEEEEEEDEFDDEVITKLQEDRRVGDDEESAVVFQLKDSALFNFSHFSIPDEIMNCDNVWELPHPQKKLLYRYWLSMYLQREKERTSLPDLCAQYEQICKERKEIEEELQTEVLCAAKIIGCTTTVCSHCMSFTDSPSRVWLNFSS